MRVYEIAREIGVPNKELIAKIRALGLEVNNHMSSLDADDVVRVKRSLEKERLDKTETKRLSSTVLRRRSKGGGDEPVVRRRPAETTQSPPREPTRATAAPEAPVRRREEPAPERARPAPSVQTPREQTAASRPEADAPRAAAAAAPPAEPVTSRAEASQASSGNGHAPVERNQAASSDPPATAPSPAPSEPASAAAPRTPVFVAGPAVVQIPGKKPVERPVVKQETAKAQPRPPSAQPQPKSGGPRRQEVPAVPVRVQGPQTMEEVTDAARSRFEAELSRARARVAEREAEERGKQEAEKPEVAEAREPGRPAVGSIISLPHQRIKITERAPTPRQTPGQGQIRGRFAQQTRGRGGPGGRKGRDFGRKKTFQKGKGKQTQITTPAEHKRVIRMEDTMAIPELARGMGVKAQEVLKKLWGMGMVGVNINASIDHDTAQLLAGEFGYEVQNVAFKEAEVFVSELDSPEDLQMRSPVVTIMGHVDHGKTSLLDYIRTARVAAGEAGGITQHVAAYKIPAGGGHGDIVFLDTPGHEAFTAMRARGAQATDIVVLVVAANDGVMPQTIEALNHAKDAKVPILVAVNKIDLPDAQPDRCRQQLADHGLIAEEWGGDTIYVDVSAHTGENVDKLLESLAVQAEVMELRANPNKSAQGIVIEAKLDRARGPMATVLIQEGTLRASDVVVAGQFYGKVRAMLDQTGRPIKEVGPSTPVELLGLDGVPEAGETLNVADDEKTAKQVVEYRRQARRKKELASTGKVSLENLMERIQEGAKELKVVLKTDVQGSAEAVKAALIKQSTDKVKVNVIQAGVGGITETDVNLAKAGGAIIIGFHVRPAGKSAKLAEQEGVEIMLYDVIYDAIDDVRSAMAGLLAPIKREVPLGQAEVRETFGIPKQGTVAGVMVTDGKIQRKSLIRVVREAVQVWEGRVGSLRRFKEDVSEVAQGYECGIMVDNFNDIRVGDIIEAYEIVEEAARLD